MAGWSPDIQVLKSDVSLLLQLVNYVKFKVKAGSGAEAPIRCDGCGIAQFTVLRTFPHNLLFSAHFRTFCNFLHISA